jgi:hypothetical protein
MSAFDTLFGREEKNGKQYNERIFKGYSNSTLFARLVGKN